MKKNYVLILLLSLFLSTLNAQTTLSHSTTQNIVLGNTVACPTEPTQFLRVYDLANEFGITADFEIFEIQFGVEASETVPITVNLYTADGTDPTTAALTNIYNASVPVGLAEEGTVVSHTLAAPITIASTDILVFELSESSDGIVFRVGSNTDGQTAPSWLRSTTCGEGTVASFGFTNHFVMDVIGNEILGLEDFSISQVNISPNPTKDLINIELHPSNSIKTVEMYSMTGQLVYKGLNETQIDLSNFNAGIYLLNVNAENGSVTKRIVKQ